MWNNITVSQVKKCSRLQVRPVQPEEGAWPFLESALWCSTETDWWCHHSPVASPPPWWHCYLQSNRERGHEKIKIIIIMKLKKKNPLNKSQLVLAIKVTLLPSRGMQLLNHHNNTPTFTDSTYLCHLSPAPLFLPREPTHYFGSNVWNAVLLGIWTTAFPAAANKKKNI